MTAKDYAKGAAQAGAFATSIKPDERDPHAPALKLAIYHLNAAAKQLRSVAEAKTNLEGHRASDL